MVRTEVEFRQVKVLTLTELSDYKIAELTGVPRHTVWRWRHRAEPPKGHSNGVASDWQIRDEPAYCYLLGCYLGDGHLIHRPPNAWSLRVACDRRYPAVIEEILSAMTRTFPEARPTQRAVSGSASEVLHISHQAVGRAFPQHGRGRKHLRPITLADWQLELTHQHPQRFLRGLVHSDGCRTTNRFRTKLPSGRVAEYEYARYFFSNLSDDIRRIFVEHCELLGVRVTQSNARNLSVSHKRSVALLDSFIGPKA